MGVMIAYQKKKREERKGRRERESFITKGTRVEDEEERGVRSLFRTQQRVTGRKAERNDASRTECILSVVDQLNL